MSPVKCGRCDLPAEPGRKSCTDHLAADSKREVGYQNARVGAGMCASAGCGLPRIGSRHCRKHADDNLRRGYAYTARRAEADPDFVKNTREKRRRSGLQRAAEIRRRVEMAREAGFMRGATKHEILVRLLDDAIIAARSPHRQPPGRRAVCFRAPNPWVCTRDQGHDGPCAAVHASTLVNG